MISDIRSAIEINNLISVDTEQAIIGGLLQDPLRFPDVAEIVNERDFYNADNRLLFSLISKLVNEGTEVDVITLGDLAEPKQEGIFRYITDLAMNVASAANVVSHAQVVSEKAQKRRIVDAANETIRHAYNTDCTSGELVEYANSALAVVDDCTIEKSGVTTMRNAIRDFIYKLDERFNSDGNTIEGLSSGFARFDEITNGMCKGRFIVIAGRPGMGKSTFGLQLAFNLSERNQSNGIFFSLEMPEDELAQKLLACFGQLNIKWLTNPKQAPECLWSKLPPAAERTAKVDLKLKYWPGAHINQICAYARKFHRQKPLDFIFLDHIHEVSSEGETGEQKVSLCASMLKTLAGQLDIPVISLAQLNRGVENRPDKRPVMSDLRGSGALEEKAHQIMFLYRDDYYNDDEDNPNKGLIQLDLAKNRMGPTEKICFEHRLDQSRLEPTNRFLCLQGKAKYDL